MIPCRSRRATTFEDGGDEAAVAPKRLLLQMKVDHEGKGKSQPLGPQKHGKEVVGKGAHLSRKRGLKHETEVVWA